VRAVALVSLDARSEALDEDPGLVRELVEERAARLGEQRTEVDQPPDRPGRGDQRDRQPRERVADEDRIVLALERGGDGLRVLVEPRRRLVRGQVDGDGTVAARLELGAEARPAPGAVPGAVNEDEGRDRSTLGLRPAGGGQAPG
jgi:hypothetical protein